jgi:uncharacterized protein YndB with AHSA1/START domain
MNASTGTVERCLLIAAPREDVYQALLDPASLSRWMYATVRMKPQKGGAYRIEWQDTELPASAQGEILEMDDGRKLVLSWFMERDGIETVASFELEDEEDGQTLLKFRHRGFPIGADWKARLEMISTEWDKTLENLRFLLEERSEEAHLFYDRHQVTLPATKERVHLQWMGPAALRQWLAREAFVDPAVDGEMDLVLTDGTRVAAKIRAFVPGKHLRVLWDEGGRRSLIGVSFWTAQEGCVMTLTQRSYAIAESERDDLRRIWNDRFASLRTLIERTPGVWSPGGERTIEVDRIVSGTRAEVWKAWTDPGSLICWFCDRAEFTLQEGHEFALLWTGYGETRGQVKGIVPTEHLRLTWDIEHNKATTTVDIRLASDKKDPKKTLVSVAHSGFGEGDSWDAQTSGYTCGWRSFLAMLDFYLREHGQGYHRTFLLRRRLATPVDQVWKRLSSVEGLTACLGGGVEASVQEGGSVRVERKGEPILEGRFAMVAPEDAIALELTVPEPAFLEIGWAAAKEGSRILVSGLSYGMPASWPLQQRILWAERLSRLAANETGGKR